MTFIQYSRGWSSLPLTPANFVSYILYPVFKSVIGFYLIFYCFDNTADRATFCLMPNYSLRFFQSVISEMSYQVNSNVSWFTKMPSSGDIQLSLLLKRSFPNVYRVLSRDTTLPGIASRSGEAAGHLDIENSQRAHFPLFAGGWRTNLKRRKPL